MSYADQSHRFVITGEDPEGHPRTIILWRETDLVDYGIPLADFLSVPAELRL